MKKKSLLKSLSLLLAFSFFFTLFPMTSNAEDLIPTKNSTNSAPGRTKPKGYLLLDDFSSSKGWTTTGIDVKFQNKGAKIKLTSKTGTLSKDFSYNTSQFSDLYVKINKIHGNLTWELSVNGFEVNDKEILIQKSSSNANSEFGESFNYSIKGIAGASPLSNWNDPNLKEKKFTLKFTFKGNPSDTIDLGPLYIGEPNYTIPKALDSNVTGIYGNVNFNGDPTLDVEKLKNDDINNSTSPYLNEHMWLSLPYSRLVLYPGYEFDNQKITPVDKNLDLRFGVYYGIKGNANKTTINNINISESKSGFQASTLNSILDIDGVSPNTNSITSAWYPHKLTRSSNFNNKGYIGLTDFLVDENTIARVIDTSKMTGKNLNITVKDSTKSTTDGMNSNNLISSYDQKNDIVLKTDSLYDDFNTNLFYSAMRVVALNDDGSYDSEKTKLIKKPNFKNGVGSYSIPKSINKVGIILSYSNELTSKNIAIEDCITSSKSNFKESYNKRVSYWNNLLRKVPKPSNYGVTDTNIKDYKIASPELQKILYYSGWVFNLINILPVTPETGYSFTQQALGKPSRQVGGSNMTPANNSWEGLLQVQNIMYVDPSAAWSSMEGFMAMVDANGYLDGEVLPVRMAQTLYMVDTVSPDKDRLESLYPALKRHLQYKISDPRWIYGSQKTENEIDQEYITSWLNDVLYMKNICKRLGGQYNKDIEYWDSEYKKALKNYSDWFFSNPTSHEAIGSYPQDGSGPKTLRNGAELPNANYQRGIWTRIFHKDGNVNYFYDGCSDNTDGSKYVHSNKGGHVILPHGPSRYPREWLQVLLAGLVIPDIPTKEAKQLEQLFMDVNNPSLPLSGIENLKWAPNSLMIYGLINKGYYDEVQNQLDSYLVKAIDVWEFCENYFYNSSGPKGTSPTSFGASQIIEITLLKNGVINDGAGVREIPNFKTGVNKPTYNETISIKGELTESNLNSVLPKEVKLVYNRENFNSEKFTINKISNVIWDLNSLNKVGQNKYTLDGETETHNKITINIVQN